MGLAYLSRYEVTFDFPNKVLYVREGKAFGKPDPTNLSGLHFLRKNGRTIVEIIDLDSPAEASGLKEGDVILGVDELDAAKTPLDELRKSFYQEGHTVRVAYERDGMQSETTIELK